MKIGDYVRTKYGIIAKITDIIEDLSIDCDRDVYYEDGLKDDMPMMEIPYYLKDEYIIKSSPNIIDLIEEGDYVNGHLIDYIDSERRYLRSERPYREDSTMYKDLIEKGRNYNQCLHFFAEDIKSIVTKEQFESMEYKINE